MAPQATRSAKYCGVVISRNSQPAQTKVVDVAQQLAGEAQAVVDLEATVEVGVVDEALPADRRPRFFEIDAHDEFEPIAEFLAQRQEALGVVDGGGRIVDGAGADDDGEAVVAAVENVVQRMARGEDRGGCAVGTRELMHQLGGRSELTDILDAQVVGGFEHLAVLGVG